MLHRTFVLVALLVFCLTQSTNGNDDGDEENKNPAAEEEKVQNDARPAPLKGNAAARSDGRQRSNSLQNLQGSNQQKGRRAKLQSQSARNSANKNSNTNGQKTKSSNPNKLQSRGRSNRNRKSNKNRSQRQEFGETSSTPAGGYDTEYVYSEYGTYDGQYNDNYGGRGKGHNRGHGKRGKKGNHRSSSEY